MHLIGKSNLSSHLLEQNLHASPVFMSFIQLYALYKIRPKLHVSILCFCCQNLSNIFLLVSTLFIFLKRYLFFVTDLDWKLKIIFPIFSIPFPILYQEIHWNSIILYIYVPVCHLSVWDVVFVLSSIWLLWMSLSVLLILLLSSNVYIFLSMSIHVSVSYYDLSVDLIYTFQSFLAALKSSSL